MMPSLLLVKLISKASFSNRPLFFKTLIILFLFQAVTNPVIFIARTSIFFSCSNAAGLPNSQDDWRKQIRYVPESANRRNYAKWINLLSSSPTFDARALPPHRRIFFLFRDRQFYKKDIILLSVMEYASVDTSCVFHRLSELAMVCPRSPMHLLS